MDLNAVLYWRNESAFNLFIQEGEMDDHVRRVSFSLLVSISSLLCLAPFTPTHSLR